MNKKLKVGDYFGLNLADGSFIIGRLIFDPTQKAVQEDGHHNFTFVQDCYLIQVYKGIHKEFDEKKLSSLETLIPGLYIYKSAFYKKLYKPNWQYLGHKKINLDEVDFPMVISNAEKYYFQYGEINIPIAMEEDLDIRRTTHTTQSQVIIMALHYMERDDIIRKDYFMPKTFLEKADVRFAEEQLQNRIFNMTGINLTKSYHELALEHGFDLSRFYK
ncbi:Imm26 family immunity protein [Sinomicrobium weinanense]|uniref:Uncharacterized protein n=1 Tax=Sinomicrobium weinanense TaxID=2842200 RepID=A0A926JVA7_9FLAO|nr:Imm26 family immunity protein [Sinomicrobium weinanense]MBC9797862.1 hypothetical protein [Sinomicrobium weinanense]MBU3122238.1 hypothetical protein [Sinomicrobium weinanense]